MNIFPKTDFILPQHRKQDANCYVQIKELTLEFRSCAIVSLTGRSCALKKMACTYASLSIHGMLQPQLRRTREREREKSESTT